MARPTDYIVNARKMLKISDTVPSWQVAYGLEMLRRHMERPTDYIFNARKMLKMSDAVPNWQFSYGWDALEMTVTTDHSNKTFSYDKDIGNIKRTRGYRLLELRNAVQRILALMSVVQRIPVGESNQGVWGCESHVFNIVNGTT